MVEARDKMLHGIDTLADAEVDLARAHLIRDLLDLGVNDEGIPIVLDPIDQIYGLRHMLRELLSTIKVQQKVHRRI